MTASRENDARWRDPPGFNRSRGAFPAVPSSWFHFCSSRQLDWGPVGLELLGQKFVGYRTQSGRAVVLAGRCAHMGVYLANGSVRGERLVCPLHGWEYGPDGVCQKVPGMDAVPGFARQCSYPVEERGGHVFWFNRADARFPLPFFEGVSPDELLAARPFELVAEMPWYFVGANGFDIQHFKMAHDRTLLAPPEVSSPSRFARRLVGSFEVSGSSFQDRLTRCIAGKRVTMDVTVWGGSMVLVRAEFARTTTFGMMAVLPVEAERTRGRIIVWVRRSKNPLGRLLFDPLNAAVRRFFIQTFLHSDLPRIAGVRYQPGNLVAADKVLAEYFAWLQNVSD